MRDIGTNMRLLLLITSLFIPFCTYADNVQCYSNGHKIYDHEVKDIRYFDQELLAFTELSSDKVILTTMDCIAKISG